MHELISWTRAATLKLCLFHIYQLHNRNENYAIVLQCLYMLGVRGLFNCSARLVQFKMVQASYYEPFCL